MQVGEEGGGRSYPRCGNPPVPVSMGLDWGPPPPETTNPWRRCCLDGAALPLPYQVEEVGGCQPRPPREPGFSTVGPGSHTGSISGTSEYEWPVARHLGALTTNRVCWGQSIGIICGFHCHKSFLWTFRVNPPECPKWLGARRCWPEQNVAIGSPYQRDLFQMGHALARECLDQAPSKPHRVRIAVGPVRYEGHPAITLCARQPPPGSNKT